MDEQAIIKSGFNIIPMPFSLQAYKTLFNFPQDILNAEMKAAGLDKLHQETQRQLEAFVTQYK